jgi:hypothetical protein
MRYLMNYERRGYKTPIMVLVFLAAASWLYAGGAKEAPARNAGRRLI